MSPRIPILSAPLLTVSYLPTLLSTYHLHRSSVQVRSSYLLSSALHKDSPAWKIIFPSACRRAEERQRVLDIIWYTDLCKNTQRGNETVADRQTSTIATTPHHTTPHGALPQLTSLALIIGADEIGKRR
jgi:hypothetical protein